MLLLLVQWARGQACDAQEMRERYQLLYESVDAYKPRFALSLADSLLEQLEGRTLSDCPLSGWVRFEKGEAFEHLWQYENALQIYYPLVQEALSAERWKLAAQTYISMARTHETIERPTDCRRSLEAAYDLIHTHRLDTVYARYAVRFSSYHRFYGNQDSARFYAAKAVEAGKRFQVQRSELDGYLLLGLLEEKPKVALQHLQAAVQLYLERQAFYGATLQKTNMARRSFMAGDFENGLLHLDTAFQYAAMIPEDYADYHLSYRRLYALKQEYYEGQGLIDSAYFYSKKRQEANEKVSVQINQKEINQKEIAFLLEQEQEKLRYEQDRAVYLTGSLIIVACLLTLLIFLLVHNEKNRRFITRQKDLISVQNQELNESLHRQSLLLSEVHHRVKNNLQLVMSLLTLQGRKNADQHVQNQFEDLSSKVGSIALIHEQLYQSGEFERVDLERYLDELFAHFTNLQNEDQPFSYELKTEQLLLNLDTVLPLGVICTELISNSLKYAQQPAKVLHLSLLVSKKADQFELCYSDNGPGYPEGRLALKDNRLGSMLIFSMVRQLQAESKSGNENGAVFYLTFKEKQVSSV